MNEDHHPPLTIAVLSHLYPRRGHEHYGVFVQEQTRALVSSAVSVSIVISPVPFAPWPLSELNQRWRTYASAERGRRDFESVPVVFPRFPSFPRKTLKRLSARFIARSIARDEQVRSALEGADVILAHTAALDGQVARRLSVRYGVPYVVVVHGEDLSQNSGPEAPEHLRAAVREALEDADAVIGVSAWVREGLRSAFPSLTSVHTLHNGVDLERFQPVEPRWVSSDNSLRLLSAGRLVKQKCHAYVLEAVARVRAAGVRIDYTIAGDGPERLALESTARELGIEDVVTFTGAYANSELPAMLQETDLFVLPGQGEAFGIVYLEALASGTPAVAATDGGACEIINEGVDGYLVDPCDAESIAKAIFTFSSLDESSRQAMRQAARRTALGFSWDANATGLVTILERVLDRHHETSGERSRGGKA